MSNHFVVHLFHVQLLLSRRLGLRGLTHLHLYYLPALLTLLIHPALHLCVQDQLIQFIFLRVDLLVKRSPSFPFFLQNS